MAVKRPRSDPDWGADQGGAVAAPSNRIGSRPRATLNGGVVAVALPAELVAVTERSTACPRSLGVTTRVKGTET